MAAARLVPAEPPAAAVRCWPGVRQAERTARDRRGRGRPAWWPRWRWPRTGAAAGPDVVATPDRRSTWSGTRCGRPAGSPGRRRPARVLHPTVRVARMRELVRWNDAAGRTREDVLALLDRAISRSILAAVGRSPRADQRCRRRQARRWSARPGAALLGLPALPPFRRHVPARPPRAPRPATPTTPANTKIRATPRAATAITGTTRSRSCGAGSPCPCPSAAGKDNPVIGRRPPTSADRLERALVHSPRVRRHRLIFRRRQPKRSPDQLDRPRPVARDRADGGRSNRRLSQLRRRSAATSRQVEARRVSSSADHAGHEEDQQECRRAQW